MSNEVKTANTIPSDGRSKTRRIVKIAMMAAIALAFSFIPSIPVMPGVDFIRYEFSDLPILIATFAYGTPAGLVVAAVSIILNFFLGGAESGPYGMIMHFIAIGAYCVAAGQKDDEKCACRNACRHCCDDGCYDSRKPVYHAVFYGRSAQHGGFTAYSGDYPRKSD